MIKNTKNLKEDDTVRVRLNLDLNEFEITLQDQNAGRKLSHRLEGTTKDKVLNYFYLLMKSFSLDEDGYENIQINVPLMPRVLFSVASLKDLYVRDHVNDLLRLGLDVLEDVDRLPPKMSIDLTPATPPRASTPRTVATVPPPLQRSSRANQTEQEINDINIQNDRYFSHMINNQRHGFFDHNA